MLGKAETKKCMNKRKTIIVLILLCIIKVVAFSNYLKKEEDNSLMPGKPNDHIIIGLNYNYNFMLLNNINSQFKNNIIDKNTINYEIELMFISYKSKILIYLGYEFFREYSLIKIPNLSNKFNSNIKNDFLLLKYKYYKQDPTYGRNVVTVDLDYEIGIGYMPYLEYNFQTDNDIRFVKENNILNNIKSNYSINYKAGIEFNIGYTPYIMFIKDIFIYSGLKLEYYHQPILTKNWNFRIELGLKYGIDLGE